MNGSAESKTVQYSSPNIPLFTQPRRKVGLRSPGASGEAQLFKQVLRLQLLKKVFVEERLRSADEWPPVTRNRGRRTRAGGSGSSLRSPCPLAARRYPLAPRPVHGEMRRLAAFVTVCTNAPVGMRVGKGEGKACDEGRFC